MGQTVAIETIDGLRTSGLLIPRYEHADSEHIVLKLKSGYNIGVRASTITSIIPRDESNLKSGQIESQESALAEEKSYSEAVARKKSKILLLSTGGTIASRVDYRTGAVHPALSASDLYSAVPELDELAEIKPEVVFSVYSENLGPEQWSILAKRVAAESDSLDGIVITMGTDTLGFAAAALSFALIGFKKTIVLTAAQRSSDRPSSDAALNLRAAIVFASNSGRPGVFVAMHDSESDDYISIHSGVRVRKNHTSRRDAFQSIDIPQVARVKGNEITFNEAIVNPPAHKSSKGLFALKTNFESRVALVKFHPGFDPAVLRYLADSDRTRGIIVEGTGLGHVSSHTVEVIADIVKKGEIFVGITSQCIWGHVDLNVYDTGRDLLTAGAIPLGNMISETALAKLSWALANFSNPKHVMLENFLGEYTERILLNQS